MSVTDCCAECETQHCVSKATALGGLRALCHWTLTVLTAHRALCHSTLAGLRAPYHWTLSALAGRCRPMWLPVNQGSPQPPALRTDRTAHPHSRKEQSSKCALYLMWITCTTMKSKNPKLNHCKLGIMCIIMNDDLFKREHSRNISSICYAPSQGQAYVQRQLNLTIGMLLGVKEMKLQCHLIVGIFYLKSEKSEKTQQKEIRRRKM